MNKIIITFVASLFIFCVSLQAQNLNLKVEYLFTVGEDLEFGEPGYLYNPVRVTTDSHGNILVADHRGRAIHKYTPDGEYLQSVGGSGRGPGEFSRITEIAVDENDDLLILDRFQFKVAKFNAETGAVEEFIYKDMPDMSTMTLAPLEGGKFATIYVDLGVPGSTDVNTNALRIYRFGEEENIASHFQIFKYQFDNRIPIEENMGRGIGHRLTSIDGNRVVAGHSVYKGKLFLIDTESGEVTLAENPNVEAPHYIEYDIDSISDSPRITGLVSASGRSGNFRYQVLHRTIMLDSVNEMIFHIFRKHDQQYVKVGDILEVYSTEGFFKGQAMISDYIKYDEDFDVRVTYTHVDSQGRLFLWRYFDDRDPDVRVYRLNIN